MELTLIAEYVMKLNQEKNILAVNDNMEELITTAPNEIGTSNSNSFNVEKISVAKYKKAIISIFTICAIAISLITFILTLLPADMEGIDLRVFAAALGIFIAWNIQILIRCHKKV